MTTYRYTADQRSSLRSAVTSHDRWNHWRADNGMRSASSLSIDELESIAQSFGLNLESYGTAKGTPKPRPYGPSIVEPLKTKFDAISHISFESLAEHEKVSNILKTVIIHQHWHMTEGQYQYVTKAIDSAYARRGDKPAPAPVPAPAPQQESPAQQPTQPAHPVPASEAVEALERLRAVLGGGSQAHINESKIIDLIKKHAGAPAHVTIDLRSPAGVTSTGDALMHYKLPMLLSAINAGVNVMLVGTAGSGKTSACAQAADMLKIPFHFCGAIDSPYKLTGFIDAQGRTVRTPFREAFEHGGVFLFDEIDASLAGAVLAFNAALANGQCDFPDGVIKAHVNFRAVAAANTFGRGADRQFVGRLQQDAAVLDRYAMLAWDIDEALESALIGAERPKDAPLPVSLTPITDAAAAQEMAARWLARVRVVRARIESNKVRHIVSPRATIMGSKLLAAGWRWPDVEESILFKGIDSDTRTKIAA